MVMQASFIATLAFTVMLAGCGGVQVSDRAKQGDAGRADPLSAGHAGASPESSSNTQPNPLRNAYFGDLHVHSRLSFDAYLFGSSASIEDSYRFARGEPLETAAGAKMQLSRPLDFAAITDHAEMFGLHESCEAPGDNAELATFCARFERPDRSFFEELRQAGVSRPPVNLFAGVVGKADHRDHARSTWRRVSAAAEAANDPGYFTTFSAYEYSPVIPDGGKLHRNVIFRGDTLPDHAISSFDAASALDLWRQLTATCEEPCDFLTILHNPNKSWGLAFSGITIDGDAYTEADWRMRREVEPILEMFQVKGNSECAPGFGATDEECSFEQFFLPCRGGQEADCIYPTSMARDGLKKGLGQEDSFGFNALNFGMIGSTDTHNSNPGDTEEQDFRGSSGMLTGSPEIRLTLNANRRGLQRNPGGLAVIWAEENTRDSLFDAMERKEVYATSGTRIRLRFFGSYSIDDALLEAGDPIAAAYDAGVPMGATLPGSDAARPSFLVWATRDPHSAPLDRVQIVKGWTRNGETHEAVFDIACSDGRSPDPGSGRCRPTRAGVDLATCEFSEETGAADLRTVWTDKDYVPMQNAFYYVRVIENPTCRWSTWDSLEIGRTPPAFPEPTVTEMAWSSPIWVERHVRR